MFECGGTNPAFGRTTEAVDHDLITVKSDYDDESHNGLDNMIYHDRPTVGNHVNNSLASTSTQHNSSFQHSSYTETLNKLSTHTNESLSNQENELYQQSCVDTDGTSAKKQRERNANFSSKECLIMVMVYQKNRKALDCRKQTQHAKERKNEIYQKMVAQVNRISFSDQHLQTPRTIEQLRTKLRKLKQEAERWRQARVKGRHAWADSKFSVEPAILDELLKVMDSTQDCGDQEGFTEKFEHEDSGKTNVHFDVEKQTGKHNINRGENNDNFKIKTETTSCTYVDNTEQNKRDPQDTGVNNTNPNNPGIFTPKKKKQDLSKSRKPRNRSKNFTSEEINIIMDMWDTYKATLNCPHKDNDMNRRKLLVYKKIVNKLRSHGAPESETRTLGQVRKKMADLKTEGRFYARMKRGQVAKRYFPTDEVVLERVVKIIEPFGRRQTIYDLELDEEYVQLQESTLNQDQRKQPENADWADCEEDNLTYIDLDQEQETQTQTMTQNTAGHSKPCSDNRDQSGTRKSRVRCKNFSPAEIDIIVSVWEVHRSLLSCTAYGIEMRKKKTMVLKKIIDQLHSLGQSGSVTRSLDQIRKKICDLKTESRIYAKMKRGERKAQRLNTNKELLERIVNITQPFGTDDADLEEDEDIQEAALNQVHINQSENSDCDEDHSTAIDLDQEQETQTETNNQNTAGTHTGGQSEKQKSRLRSKKFSTEEINIILGMWEGHRQTLNCPIVNSETNKKKIMVVKKMVNRLHRLGGSVTRTVAQVRKKLTHLKIEGRLYAKMKLGQVAPRHFQTDEEILERVVNIIQQNQYSEGEDTQESTLSQEQRNQSEKTDCDEDNSTDTNLDQEQETQTETRNQTRAGHSTLHSNHGLLSKTQNWKSRFRSKNFSPHEINIILCMWEAHRKTLNCRFFDKDVNKKKMNVMEKIVNQLHSLGEPWSTTRTIPQVKKKMTDLKLEASIMCKKKRGEKSRGHLHSNKKVLDRVVRIMGGCDDYDPVSGTATGGNAEEKIEREYVSTMIQKHLQSLVNACRDLRQLGVETGSMVFDNNSVMWCGSQNLQRIATHPHFSRIITGDAAHRVDDDKADEWTMLNLPPQDSSVNTPSCSTTSKDTHIPADTQNPLHHAEKIRDFSPISVETVHNESYMWNTFPSGSSSHTVGQSVPVLREGFSDATQNFVHNVALSQNSVSTDRLQDSTENHSHTAAQNMPVLREGFTDSTQNLAHNIPFTFGQNLNSLPAENQMPQHNMNSVTSVISPHSFADSVLHGSSTCTPELDGENSNVLVDALSALDGTFVSCGRNSSGVRGEETLKTRTPDAGSSFVTGTTNTTTTTTITTPNQLSSSPSFICDICQALFSHLTTFIQHRQRHAKEAEMERRFTVEDLSVNDNDENLSENDIEECLSTNDNEENVPVSVNSDGGSRNFNQVEEFEKEDETLPVNSNCLNNPETQDGNLSINAGGMSSGIDGMELKTEVLDNYEEDPTLNRRIKEVVAMLEGGSAQITKYPSPNDHMRIVTDEHTPFVNRFGVLDSRPRRFACNICGKKFVVAKHCRQHIQGHTGEKPHRCDQCGKSFIQKNSLKLHVLSQHRKEHVCDLCDRRFSSYYFLKDHQTTAHPVLKPEADRDSRDDVFKCELCGKVFPTIHGRKKHEITHLGLKPFKCDLCPKTFSNKKYLASHKDRHKGIRRFQCQECGFKFTEKCNLILHMRLHSGDTRFKCEFCGQGFVKSSALTVHRRNHTGERPFLCDICGEGFIQGGKLTLHRRKHTGEKAYRCEDCGEHFFHKYQLTVHRRYHTGIHPYTCSVCGKHFQKNKHLTIHMRLHTGEKPFVCDVCGDKFHRSDVLFIHKKKHNPDLTPSYPATNNSYYALN